MTGSLIGVAGLAFVVRRFLRDRDAVLASLDGASLPWLVLAFVVALLSMSSIGGGWLRITHTLGERPRPRSLARWYFVGQLGKYVPGGIWPVLGRGELARRGGLAGAVAYASVLLSLGATYLAAAVLVATLAPLGIAGDARSTVFTISLLIPLGAFVTHPRVLEAGKRLVRRVTGRTLDVPEVSWGRMAWLIVSHVPSWVGIGAATWMVARALTPEPDVVQILLATALSWLVGFLAIPVPGGLGVREAVFVTAAASLTGGIGAAVALVARLLFMAVDVTGAVVSTLLAPPEPPAHEQPAAGRED